MWVSIRRSDAVALALAFWGATAALPHLLWLLKRDCVASCIDTYPGSGDILLITGYSADIANTGALFGHPDPFLRYIPIAVAMVVGDIVGPFEPVVVTVGYTWVWEFVILPVALYLAVRWTTDAWTGALAVGLLVLTTHGSLPFPWPPSAFGTGNYQYALGVPSALLALGASAWDDRGLWTAFFLGITANIQIAIAAIAAFTLAARYALSEQWHKLGVVAGTSFVIALPTFVIYATSPTSGQIQSRALRLSGGLTAAGLLVAAGTILFLIRTNPAFTDRLARAPFALATMVCGLVVIAGLVDGFWWYPYVGGYVGHVTFAAGVSVGISENVAFDAVLTGTD